MSLHKKSYVIWILALIVLVTTSCEDEDLAPIVTFDSAEKGAFIRRVSETERRAINLDDLSNSIYNYQVEFVDIEDGATITEYIVNLGFEDNTSINGSNSVEPVEFRRFGTSDFITNEDGFVGVAEQTVTVSEMLSALGLTEDQIFGGDDFEFETRIITQDGSVFSFDNSSATVRSSTNAFAAHFNFDLRAFCPSTLAGTYSYVTTSFFCDSTATITGEVALDAEGNSNGGEDYTFSDWSFGAYDACIAPGETISDGLSLREVCETLEFTSNRDGNGITWSFDSSVDGTEWTINWSNNADESGSTVITNPDGWNFSIVE